MKSIDYLKSEYHNDRHWALTSRSDKILEYFEKYVPKDASILELGCSSGRNLVALRKAGYTNLTGLEMYPIQKREEFKLIRGRWEETELREYDIIFSASFLQEFFEFPQALLDKTLERTKKYFMIFGDCIPPFQYSDFEMVEKTKVEPPFSEPIIILKRI